MLHLSEYDLMIAIFHELIERDRFGHIVPKTLILVRFSKTVHE